MKLKDVLKIINPFEPVQLLSRKHKPYNALIKSGYIQDNYLRDFLEYEVDFIQSSKSEIHNGMSFIEIYLKDDIKGVKHD